MNVGVGGRLLVSRAVFAVLAIVALGCSSLRPADTSSPTASSLPTVAATASPAPSDGVPSPTPTSAPPTDAVPATFPKTVLGMPVLSITELSDIISTGKLDGRVAAVRGYWLPTMQANCGAPTRWYAPIEHRCGYIVFSDPGFQLVTCSDTAQGTDCHGNTPPPGTTYMTPALVDDEANAHPIYQTQSDGNDPEGTPAVLVGHVDDPRYFQCPPDARLDCKKAFVVDQIAWIDGTDLEVGVRDDPDLKPKMTLEQVATALGGDELLTAIPDHANVAPALDPRLRAVGDSVVWVVRSLRESGQSVESDPTRAVDVWLVDDATASVSQQLGLEIDPAYQPAFIRVQAAARGIEQGSDLTPFYRIDAADGTGVLQQAIGGWTQMGVNGETRFGVGMPAVVDPGMYELSAWIAPYDQPDPPAHPCLTDSRLAAGAELRTEVHFAADGSCEFRDPTFPESPE